MMAGAARVAAHSFVETPLLALVVQALHGPSFALLWIAGVSYAHSQAPEGLGATAQGQFMGVKFGLGGAVGALVGGTAFEHVGMSAMYRGAAAWLLLGLATYLLLSRFVLRTRAT